MVAIKHIRSSPPATAGWTTAGTGEHPAIENLLRQAAVLGLRAPELTVVFGERAASLAETAGSDELWVRAESSVVSARVRLGWRAGTVGRAVAVLRAAEDAGEAALAAGLRTDLALCARSVGVPLTGLAALRPVLDMAEVGGVSKAAALCQLVGCLSQFGRKPELDRTLAEADRLCGADDDLDGDDRLLARALVRVAMSAHRRRHADIMGAADAARTGLGLLEQLEDPGCDGGVVRVRLILQLVCSLLDRGDTENAAEIAESVLVEPERAASVAPLGWLRMAVATRVLLPAGSVEAAAVMLRDAVHSTDRHGLPALTARLWAELAHVEERLGRASEAIECLHHSRAAEHVHARARRQAMGMLAGEFGNGGHATLDLDDVLRVISGSDVDTRPTVDMHAVADAEHAAPGRNAENAGTGRNVEHGGAGRNGQVVAHPAVDQGRRQGGHTRPEPDAAEHTVIIPRIVAPVHEKQAETRHLTPAGSESDTRAPEAGGKRRAEELSSSGTGRRAATGAVGERQLDAEPKSGRRAATGAPGERRVDVESTGGRRRAAEGASAERLAGVDPAGIGEPRPVTESAGGTQALPKRRRADESRSEDDKARRAARPEIRLAPVPADSADVPDLPLAPPPADEPATPRVSLVLDRESESRAAQDVADDRPTAAADADFREEPEPASAQVVDDEQRKATTRHDAEHGSVAARSVLDRLGISAGSGGGRRRAANEDDESASASKLAEAAREDDSQESKLDVALGVNGRKSTTDGNARHAGAPDVQEESSGSARHGASDRPRHGTAEDSGHGAAEDEGHERPDEPRLEASEDSTRGSSADDAGAPVSAEPEVEDRSVVVNDPWLPRLKLPPSLEPFEDFGDDMASTSTHFTSTPAFEDDGLGEPFRSEYNGSPLPDDDLPEDAGLADLLARALAEHQAGTSSAAALVKRLGNQGSDERRTVNGHSRNGESPNGRHRGDR
ncbi:hypothetical protein [Amycolatopsis dongchuanensis]|uniref:Uncharacterized protein n=1 Tax=Amycolatopsis dongchuanensis TaxID=1070866 RepID=A0ABP8VGP1_9PSEU